VAVAAEVEQDGLGLAGLAALLGLVDGGAHRVVGLRRRQDALGLGELDAGVEALQLVVARGAIRPSLARWLICGAMPW
jgi:hypothetical protein